MRIYYFTSQEYGLQALRRKRLKVARLNELNDPFELLGWDLRDKQFGTKLRAYREQLNAKIGFICFSQKWSHPLLWSHYADKHKGIAIGFNVPEGDLFQPVTYHRTRLPPPQDWTLENSDLLLNKFNAWAYESEYRCFCRLADCIEEGGLFFEPFSDKLKPMEVILGDQSTITPTELAEVFSCDLAHLTALRANPTYSGFSVARSHVNDL